MLKIYISQVWKEHMLSISLHHGNSDNKKRVRIMEWHKELPYNKGFYKQFHLSSDAYGCIHCNRYYIVELMHAEKSYGIYIPSYDISILEHLTRQKT